MYSHSVRHTWLLRSGAIGGASLGVINGRSRYSGYYSTSLLLRRCCISLREARLEAIFYSLAFFSMMQLSNMKSHFKVAMLNRLNHPPSGTLPNGEDINPLDDDR